MSPQHRWNMYLPSAEQRCSPSSGAVALRMWGRCDMHIPCFACGAFPDFLNFHFISVSLYASCSLLISWVVLLFRIYWLGVFFIVVKTTCSIILTWQHTFVRGGVIIRKRENFSTMSLMFQKCLNLRPHPRKGKIKAINLSLFNLNM